VCRLLWAHAAAPFDPVLHLAALAEISRTSPEYQGHGWGCAWLEQGQWRVYRDIRPIWEDDLGGFPETTLLVGHARSAFRDEGIMIENNMPFFDGEKIFIFNGELQGVRIREHGRIGAEKVFNYLKRFDQGGRLAGVRRGIEVIEKRSRYVRALNLVVADPHSSILASLFNENPGYFQMHRGHVGHVDVACSQPYPDHGEWQAIPNRSVIALQGPEQC